MSGDRLRVIAAIAPVHREPRVSSEQVSQYVHGSVLELLGSEDAWRRVRGADGYSGWVHVGYTGAGGARAPARFSLGCTVRTGNGDLLPLPFGALVPHDVQVVTGEALGEEERLARHPAEGEAIARSARAHFAGTPYQWGGVTPWGADCSGFTQAIFALHGLAIPRDASLQAASARRTDTGAGDAPAGDLLFFSERGDGAITHVGIALGGGAMAHCALGRGGKRVEDLRAPDDYLRALLGRFRFTGAFTRRR